LLDASIVFGVEVRLFQARMAKSDLTKDFKKEIFVPNRFSGAM
jgi:hypothetical protein